jgi:IrrE N-terminal-like domain
MKRKTKNILREMAKHLGLKVVFVSYLTADVHGKFLPREKRILLNAAKARYEHVYTMLHELGHFLIHVRKCVPNTYNCWYLNRRWKIDAIAALASRVRRHIRFIFNKQSGKEWEADLWAMCALIYLRKFIGRSYLTAFLHRHPEKTSVFLLAACGFIYRTVQQRTKTAFRILCKPFSMIAT